MKKCNLSLFRQTINRLTFNVFSKKLTSENNISSSRYSCESGRTVVEALGFMIPFSLLMFGGVTLFSSLNTRTIARNLENAMTYRVVVQQHGHLASKKNNTVYELAPHSIPMVITDGEGDFTRENLFWIDLGDATHPINKDICKHLIKSKALPFIKVTLNGENSVATEELCQDENAMRFYFWKRKPSSSNNLPSISVKQSGCSEILCPVGAKCEQNTFSCQPGYIKTGYGCSQTCVPCRENSYSNTENAVACTECEGGSIANKTHTACISAPAVDATI